MITLIVQTYCFFLPGVLCTFSSLLAILLMRDVDLEGTNINYSIFLISSTEMAMAPHCSTLAWKTPWMEEPGRLQSMGSLSWTRLSNFTFTFHFHVLEKEMAPTPVFLPGESQGRGSLVGCSPWGRTELDMTEVTWQQQHADQ